MNALHDREAMYPGCDAARLGERLRRLPGAYGLQELRMGDGAVVGVWQSGERVVRESARGVTHLSLFATEASRAAPLLRAWQRRSRPSNSGPPMPEPHDLAARGLYVDHVYW